MLAPQRRQTAQSAETLRRRLRLALRQAREEAELTQKAAAAPLEWSQSKIIRIEQGAVGVTTTDLRALLEVYGVKEESRVNELLQLARGSKKRTWGEYGGVYSPATLELFGSEAFAREIVSYEPTFVPGLLQTEEYAKALFRGLGFTGEKEIDLRVAARTERQELHERDDGPQLHIILGETVISRAVGGAGVMRRQLERLKEMAQRPGVTLQVLPFSAGAHPHMGGAFTVLEFVDEDSLLYLEHAGGDALSRNKPDSIADYLELFELLKGLASPPSEFAAIIDDIAANRFSTSRQQDQGSDGSAVTVDPPDHHRWSNG